MARPSATGYRLVVIARPTDAAASTVEYALREARDLYAELDVAVSLEVHVLQSTTDDSIDSGLEAEFSEMFDSFDISDCVETSLHRLDVREGEADAHTTALAERFAGTDEHVDRFILAADTAFGVDVLRERLGVTTVELAPTATPHVRRQLLHPSDVRRLVTIFGVSYLFYLAIGGFVGGLDLLTGAISAGIVALALAKVTLKEPPTIRRTGGRLVRMVAYAPVLIAEIVKANLVIAYVILHPSLPIDPEMGVVETATAEPLERMVLANSITLTPGTLVVNVREKEFTVHALTAGAVTALPGGRLERLVSWVFHGSDGPADELGGDS